MKRRSIFIIICAIWLGTFILIIPAGIKFPYAASLVGVLGAMSFPITLARRPEINFIFVYSYWIGVLTLFVVSGLVVFVSPRGKSAAKVVGIVDLVVVAISLIIGVLSAR